MSSFNIISDSTSVMPKFYMTKRKIVFRAGAPLSGNKNSMEAELGAFQTSVEGAITHAMALVAPNDKIGLTFELGGVEERRPGYLSFRKASEVTFNDVWKVLETIFQSGTEALSSGDFNIVVTSIRPPVGQGRQRIYNTFEEECRKRRGIVAINNNDNLCLPRALVVGRALAMKDLEYKRIRDRQGIQKQTAMELMREAGVSIPTVGAGVEELKSFQQHLKNFKITVYRYGTKGREVLFEGSEAPLKINLLHDKNHYNVITSLTSAFVCEHFCDSCHVPYDHKNDHRCSKSCAGCGSSPPCKKEAMLIKCQNCKRNFYSPACYANHQTKMCAEVVKCEGCFKTINIKLRKTPHVCGEVFCSTCGVHKPDGHFCYITPAKKTTAKKQDTLFVFFDLETRQEKEISMDVKVHEPNLCVFAQVCPECHTDTNKLYCSRCELRERGLKGNKCVEEFMQYLLEARKKFKKVVAIAHNGQAFNTQFILNHLITRTSLKPELIMRGSKILMLEVDNLRFIDSLNYFPMALAALPKAFDLPAPKGYFPHLFNTTANADYVGPLPALHYYSPETIKPGAREEFLKWYEANKGK